MSHSHLGESGGQEQSGADYQGLASRDDHTDEGIVTGDDLDHDGIFGPGLRNDFGLKCLSYPPSAL